MTRAGGFGRYQFLLFGLLASLCGFGAQLQYNYAYLTNSVKYECELNGSWEACEAEYICLDKESVEYRPVESDINYMVNFYTQMDMVCWSSNKISFIAQNYFFGFALGFILISLPEKYGRTKTMTHFILPL